MVFDGQITHFNWSQTELTSPSNAQPLQTSAFAIQQVFKVERIGTHCEHSVSIHGPFVRGSIPVELEPVAVRIVQIQSKADTVIAGSIQLDSRTLQPSKCIRERGFRWVANRSMKKSRRTAWWWGTATTLPCVEADMMVIVASCEERCLSAISLLELEAKDVLIKCDGALEIGNFEVNVTDVGAWIDGFLHVTVLRTGL